MNINATLIGQTIAFAVFVWFCMKFVWPPVMSVLAERQKKIADGLAAADRASLDLDLAKEKAGKQLAEAKLQASEIIEAAHKHAAQIVEEAKTQARNEGERLKASAQAEIEREITQARETLRTQVGVLAVAGAEKILGESIDPSVQDKFVDQLAAEL